MRRTFGGGVGSIPPGTYAATPTPGTPATALVTTGDQTVDSASTKTFGRVRVKNKPFVMGNHPDYAGGMVADNAIDNGPRLAAAILEAKANRCPVWIEPSTTEYRFLTQVVLPKDVGFGLAQFGNSRTGVRMKWVGLGSTVPCVKWDDTPVGHVEHQVLENIRIERNNEGPCLEFRQSAGNTGSLGDRWRGTIRNVYLVSSVTTGGTLCTIEYIGGGPGGRIDDLLFDGGVLGLHLINGSQGTFNNIRTGPKATAPSLVFIDTGTSHTFISPRGEGDRAGYCYKLLNTKRCILITPQSEGDVGESVYHVENDAGSIFENAAVALPNNSLAAAPRGIKLIGSRSTRFIGGFLSRFDTSFPGVGKALEIDSTSKEIVIDGMAIEGNSPLTEILDAGAGSRIRVYAQDSSPAYTATTPTPLLGGGVIGRGATAKVGTETNHSVTLVQNNQTRATIDANGITMEGRMATKASSSSASGFRIPHGSAPAAPVDGDSWTTTGGKFDRINGATLGTYVGTGSPEGVVTAPVASTYRRLDGGTGTCLYVKESGTGNTGWVAK